MTKLLKRLLVGIVGLTASVGAAVRFGNNNARSASAAAPTGWSKITAITQLADGDKILIGTNDGLYYCNEAMKSGHFQTTELSSTSPANTTAAGVITLEAVKDAANTYKLHGTTGYLVATAASSGKGAVKTSDDNGWKFAAGDALFNIQYTSNNAYLRSYQNTTFRTYGSKNGDEISIYKYSSSAQKVDVTGVSLDKTSLELEVGETFTLTDTVAPDNATNQDVTWSSNNETVATVSSSGAVTAVGVGNATITVTTDDGNKTATCAVTVVAATPTFNTTFDLTKDETVSASASELKWKSSYVDMVFAKAGSSTPSNNYYPGTPDKSYISTRTYSGSKITLTAAGGYYIKRAVFAASESKYATALSGSTFTNGVPTTSGNNVTVTASSEEVSTINITLGATAGFTKVDVVCVSNGAPEKTFKEIVYTDAIPDKVTYEEGDAFDPTGLQIFASYTEPTYYPNEDITDSIVWGSIAPGQTSVTGVWEDHEITISGITVNAINGDLLDREFTGVANGATTYTDWKDKVGKSGTVYAGSSAGNNDSIQLRYDSKESKYAGIITTTSVGTFKSIKVKWSSKTVADRQIVIYGSNTPYTSYTDLLDSKKQGTEIGKISTSGTILEETENSYKYIGIRSVDGAVYLEKIVITWEKVDVTAQVQTFVNNYMHMSDDAYEGSGTGLCKSAGTYAAAKAALLALGADAIEEFKSNSDFDAAQARYEAWASANNDVAPYSQASGSGRILLLGTSTDSMSAVIIVSIIVGVAAVGLLLLKKKKATK